MSDARMLFLAVPLPPALHRQLAPLLGQLAAVDPKVRPARLDGLHLTLRFLGPVEPPAEPALRLVADRVARETPAFPVEVQGLGVFAESLRPRIVWAGVGEGQAELKGLAETLAVGLSALGWPPERRPFLAHCTLARVSLPLGDHARAALAELCHRSQGGPPLVMRAGSLDLLESVKAPGGPNRYPRLARWRFPPR